MNTFNGPLRGAGVAGLGVGGLGVVVRFNVGGKPPTPATPAPRSGPTPTFSNVGVVGGLAPLRFNLLMYSLPIEIGNKIFNYIMLSKGGHKKLMKHICKEIEENFKRDKSLQAIFTHFKVSNWVGLYFQ